TVREARSLWARIESSAKATLSPIPIIGWFDFTKQTQAPLPRVRHLRSRDRKGAVLGRLKKTAFSFQSTAYLRVEQGHETTGDSGDLDGGSGGAESDRRRDYGAGRAQSDAIAGGAAGVHVPPEPASAHDAQRRQTRSRGKAGIRRDAGRSRVSQGAGAFRR